MKIAFLLAKIIASLFPGSKIRPTFHPVSWKWKKGAIDVISDTVYMPNGKMAATGVLPFVRGVDLTHNDFSVN